MTMGKSIINTNIVFTIIFFYILLTVSSHYIFVGKIEQDSHTAPAPTTVLKTKSKEHTRQCEKKSIRFLLTKESFFDVFTQISTNEPVLRYLWMRYYVHSSLQFTICIKP